MQKYENVRINNAEYKTHSMGYLIQWVYVDFCYSFSENEIK